MYRNHPIDPALRLQPGQEALTPAQEAEAKRFAAERIAAQLATEPVDEWEAEALLKQAYVMGGLLPPQHVYWVDGPLQLVQLVAALAPQSRQADAARSVEAPWVRSVADSAVARLPGRMPASVRKSVWNAMYETIQSSVRASVGESVRAKVRGSVRVSRWQTVRNTVTESVAAYQAANRLAFYRFFDHYFEPNELHALAHFNELVSGYRLGNEVAVIVRRPRVLARNEEGKLHSATGKCIEYRDGWGF
jgi:hypothetical protein